MEDHKRVRELLQGTANLEFWETYENSEVINYLIQANSVLRDILANNVKSDTTKISPAAGTTPADTAKTSQSLEELISKDTAKAKASTREEFNLQNPLFGILNPRVDEQGQPLPSCNGRTCRRYRHCAGKQVSPNEPGSNLFSRAI